MKPLTVAAPLSALELTSTHDALRRAVRRRR